MRTRILSLTASLLVPAIIGCGDDNNDNKIDAAPPEPDAAKPVFKGFDADEGGEVRFEYVRGPAPTSNASTRVTAFAYKDAGPTKFFPFLNLNGCTDVSNNPMVWPMATNAIATRQYYDIGKVIIAGGPQPLQVPRAPMARDPFYRQHPANGWNFYFQGVAANDAANFQTAKTSYDVIFTGSAEFPAQVFDDVLYMPSDFQLMTPDSGPVTLTADTAQTFTWQVTDTNVPAGYTIQSLVAFTGPLGPKVVCIEPNDGSITVPKEMINIVRTAYPTTGTLARQTLTHVVRELKDKDGVGTGKRIDFIAVWCYATTFNVQ